MTRQIVFDIVLFVFAIMGIVATGIYIYIVKTIPDVYTNSTATFATSVTDPQTGEKLAPFEIRSYANKNGSGKRVVELSIRAYSDPNRQTLYNRGYQLVYDGVLGLPRLFYCDGYNSNSWQSLNPYDETAASGQYKHFYYIDIQDKTYAIRLDGYTDISKEHVDGWKIFRTIGTMGANLLFSKAERNSKWTTTEVTRHYYTYSELLMSIGSMLDSQSYGTGSFKMPLVDLGRFIHVYEVDEVGKADPEPIGKGGQINSYFSFDCFYSRSGMTLASQSMFGSVAGDNNYNTSGIDFNVNYWQTQEVYTITEAKFDKRYSTAESGYYYYLDNSIISMLNRFKDQPIDIIFDITKIKNLNVLGFDYYALQGLKNVRSITIVGNGNKTFTLLSNSLSETNINKIIAQNVVINNMSGSEVEIG